MKTYVLDLLGMSFIGKTTILKALDRSLEISIYKLCKIVQELYIEIIKALKVLQDLDISLDILVETGIGKTVNSFRKHATAGNVAKTLVKQWKKLIPPENKSGRRGRKQNTEKEKDETKSSISKEIKPSEKSKASVLASRSSNSALTSKKLHKQRTCSEKTHQSRGSESQKECDNKECSSSGSKHASQGTNPQAKESDFKEGTSTGSKKASEKQHSAAANKDLSPLKEKPSKDSSKQRNPKHVKKPKQKLVIKSKAELSSDEEFEPPTMSFESYLNYDQVTKKRKRKACPTGEQPKKCSEQKNSSLPQKTSTFSHAKEGVEDVKKCEGDQSETPNKKAKVASLQDLLNTPLPKFLTGISISSPPYAADFKASLAPAVETPQQVSEVAEFTGRRLNSKMQVYSGSKTVCLSKMLTLYEQCIRVLQNNTDSLHEVGGVPFEILEPVLTRCTPEQLFRIEECNPVNSDLLNSGNHGGHEASSFLAHFLIKILHGLHWFSVLHTYFSEFSCHYQAFFSQVSGFKAFGRIITDH
ncbi:uncharacterized protein RG961_000359 isoform 1-T1 [Leptosomus discolor]